MKRLKPLSALILIVLALLLSVARSDASNQRRDQKHEAKAARQTEKTQPEQIQIAPSPAFQAAILKALRAIVSEEVARQKQEHSDYKKCNTPAFWLGDVG